MKKFCALLLIVALVLSFTGCGPKQSVIQKQNADKVPVAMLEMADGGVIRMELYPKFAPNTVANFISLIQSGYYDGLTFHRAVPDFVIQGGDPEGNGRGGPGYAIKGEFSENKFKENTLSHKRGVVSMARSQQSYDSAGSQFFIMINDLSAPQLDGNYAAFGKVIEGMEVVDRIAQMDVKNASTGQIADPPVIAQMTVELNGYIAQPPEMIKK